MPRAARFPFIPACGNTFQAVVRLAVLLAAAVLAQACSDSRAVAGTVSFTACHLRHLAQAAQCTSVRVPEDRSQPGGRSLDLFVAVLPANTADPRPDPLVILAGGPGQAASALAPLAQRLREVRRMRAIVLVDQRGTGRSAPLDCRAFAPDERVDLDLDPGPKARACLAELRERGVDPAQYTTTAFVADLEAVRAALGYPALNLWGGSYGTRVAQEYLRRHPDRVRSVVLDGVAPPSLAITLDAWQSRQAALEAALAACAADRACATALPDPPGALANLEHALATPRRVTFTDPRTGADVTLDLTFDQALAALQPLTYAPEFTSLLPQILGRAVAGDYGPLAAASVAFASDSAEQMNAALHFSVTCAEDVPRTGALPQPARRGQALAAQAIAVCNDWPHQPPPADFATPVTSNVPVLLLSGGLDPVTPPRYAEIVAQTLPRHRHIVAPGLGHIVTPHACAPQLVARFVEDAGFERLPAPCVAFLEATVRPPFFTGLLSAQP
jgi:pimeloyl-ACP methyl ester carboxylesterase